MNFKGFGDWIEVFKGGTQTDSQGIEHDGDALIDLAIEKFDPSHHEPPVVIGHPKANAPAFGWVEGLKKEIKDGVTVLFARLRQVAPEFEDMVRRGLFKKRSASFYPDGRLRHIGFLGAAPPAVKGLKDVEFNNNEDHFDFDGPAKERSMKEVLDILKFWEGWKKDNAPIPPQEKDPAPAKSFSEADLEAAKKAAAKEAAIAERTKVEAEFAEREREAAKSQRKEAIKSWYDDNLKAGKIAPAWGKMGLMEFMERLDADEAEISFAEGKDKISLYEWFRSFMEALPKVVEFKEIAGRDTDDTPASEKLTALAQERAKKDNISFQDAMILVGKENPELTQELLGAEGGR